MTPTNEENRGLLSRFLSLDLEVSVRDRRIRALAGIRGDSGRTCVFPGARESLQQALARLDDVADGAEFLLGHNLIKFDLDHLRAAAPELNALRLPAVDTLWLNPLAFPRNPYHHLVKQPGRSVKEGPQQRPGVGCEALHRGVQRPVGRCVWSP